MCWNQHVSLNTFLFSTFVLILIIYNNKYTQYKIKELNNTWMYIFLFSFILMQLIEFFIWRNLNNKYNQIWSNIAVLLLLFQPIASVMILSNIEIRNVLLFIYLIVTIPYSIYMFSSKKMNSTVKNGNLFWNFFESNAFSWIFGLFFFSFSFFYEKKYKLIIFILALLVISYINYKKNGAVGTMWCWLANTTMIYYAIYLLLYLPFKEQNKIC